MSATGTIRVIQVFEKDGTFVKEALVSRRR